MLQGQALAAAGPGVWHFEGRHFGHLLLNDALCRLLHDVPPDPGAVGHQALHHLQHARGEEGPRVPTRSVQPPPAPAAVGASGPQGLSSPCARENADSASVDLGWC